MMYITFLRTYSSYNWKFLPDHFHLFPPTPPSANYQSAVSQENLFLKSLGKWLRDLFHAFPRLMNGIFSAHLFQDSKEMFWES